MIEIVKIGESGVSRYVDELIQNIKDNSEEFVSIASISDRNRNYSFLALFKDKCVVGKHSALLHEWGANDGASGEANGAFKRMNSFIDEHCTNSFKFTLSEQDTTAIGYSRKATLVNEDEHIKVWRSYARKLLHITL